MESRKVNAETNLTAISSLYAYKKLCSNSFTPAKLSNTSLPSSCPPHGLTRAHTFDTKCVNHAMQCDEASNQRTNQSAIDEGGREQQNRHSCHDIMEHIEVADEFITSRNTDLMRFFRVKPRQPGRQKNRSGWKKPQ